jgi:hypothetical protein
MSPAPAIDDDAQNPPLGARGAYNEVQPVPVGIPIRDATGANLPMRIADWSSALYCRALWSWQRTETSAVSFPSV